MIFRSIASALRRQDWYAVAIEFGLVVAGVLGALELDTRAKHRDNQRAYEAALDRLRGEIAANLETINLVEEEVSIELPMVRAALDALETCSDDADTLRTVNDGLAFISGTSGLTQRDNALGELTSSAELLALQTPAIRFRLADLLFYQEVVDREARFNELMPFENRPERISVLSPGPLMERQTRYLGIDHTSERRLPQLNVPVSVACENSELVGALWAWVRFQATLPVLTKKMREEYRLTLELLDQQLAQ